MAGIVYDQMAKVDITPFAELVGEDIATFIFESAPRKVATRAFKSLDHFVRAGKLEKLDEEMGAIRLIAGEEELVVAIFEWLKLNEDSFPEHKDFVRKFKNHVVKLAFYPVLQQFRFVVSGMLEDGITLEGMEGILNWTAKPVVDGKQIKLALCAEDGSELIRMDPFAIDISHGDLRGKDAVPVLLAHLTQTIKDQQDLTLKQFLMARADFRNHMLYATDGGSAELGDSFADLRETFKQTYHDLLWVLALVLGGKPPSKTWGIASQFIAVYRGALIEAGILRTDNTVTETANQE